MLKCFPVSLVLAWFSFCSVLFAGSRSLVPVFLPRRTGIAFHWDWDYKVRLLLDLGITFLARE